MKLKYVIGESMGLDYAIFSDCGVEHSRLASGVGGRVEAAGFCSFATENGVVDEVWVWGESVSLGVKSREEDALIIKRCMNRT